MHNSPLWFLTALFVTDTTFIFFLMGKKKWIVKLLVVCVITYLCTYLPILLPWSIDIAGVGVLFTAVGYKFGKNKKCCEAFMRKYAILWIGLYLVLAFFNASANISTRYYGKYRISFIIYIAAGIVGTGFAWGVSKAINRYVPQIGSLLAFVGRNTLPILGLHYFIYCVLYTLIVDGFGWKIYRGVGYAWFEIVVAVLISVLAGKTFNFLKERYI